MITAAMTGVAEPGDLSGAMPAPDVELSPLPFERVYERHAGPVYRFCLSQTGNVATVEDVASDTFAPGLATSPTPGWPFWPVFAGQALTS
jgi:hypothetical protein